MFPSHESSREADFRLDVHHAKAVFASLNGLVPFCSLLAVFPAFDASVDLRPPLILTPALCCLSSWVSSLLPWRRSQLAPFPFTSSPLQLSRSFPSVSSP